MYKVLLVDDELLARVGIKSMIPWEKYNFQIVGEADNGQKAMEQIEKLQPDIVISDAKMPVMDGVNLVAEYQQKNSAIKFIILSAYSDFNYARNTLKNGAVDYLLKLELEPEILLAVLQKAVKQIEEDKNVVSRLSENEPEQPDIEEFYRSLIMNNSKSKSAYSNSFFETNHLPCSNMAVILVKVFSESGQELKQFQFKNNFNIISNILYDVSCNYGKAITVELPQLATTGIILEPEAEGNFLRDSIRNYCESIISMVKYLLNSRCCLGISKMHHNLSELSQARKEAQKAMRQAILFDSPYYIVNMCPVPTLSEIPLENEIIALEKSVLDLNYDDIMQGFEELFNSIAQNITISSEQLICVCYMTVSVINHLKRELGFNDDAIWSEQKQAYKQIIKLNGEVELVEFIKQMQAVVIRLLHDKDSNVWILKAKDYVKKHIDEYISLSQVSNEIGISSGYFCKIFKEYTGENFINYVNKKKINRAKELLSNSSYKIMEIATMLGFDNTTYFSKLFKKLVDMTPQEYRQGMDSIQNRIVPNK